LSLSLFLSLASCALLMFIHLRTLALSARLHMCWRCHVHFRLFPFAFSRTRLHAFGSASLLRTLHASAAFGSHFVFAKLPIGLLLNTFRVRQTADRLFML